MDQPVTLILGLGQMTGEAVARRFADEGHAVVACDQSQKRVEKFADSLRDRAIVHQEDLDTQIGVKNALAAALETYGKVDHIVAVPPIPPKTAFTELNVADFEKAHIKALRTSILILKMFERHVAKRVDEAGETLGRKKQLGSVTFVLSLSAQQVSEGDFADAVMQHAILGVVRSGAVDLASKGIRVNAICALRPRAESEDPSLRKRTPLGRASLADEIAEAALYMSSPKSAIITGETLIMDGGRSRLSGIIDDFED